VDSLAGEGLVDKLTGVPVDLALPVPGERQGVPSQQQTVSRAVIFLLSLRSDRFCMCPSPPFHGAGFGGSYRHSAAESLSARRSIRIDTSVPEVVRVTSPLKDGVYGEGDVVFIDVVFNKEVEVGVTSGVDYLEAHGVSDGVESEDIRVQHEERRGRPFMHVVVGRIDERIKFAQAQWYPPPETKLQYTYLRKAYYASHEGSVVRFRYVVQDLDYSLRLDYADQNALHLNGGWIKRAATMPTTDASVTLPPTKGVNSLFGQKYLIIYPLPARVVNVVADGGSGNYGAFEVIKVRVQFGWGLLAGCGALASGRRSAPRPTSAPPPLLTAPHTHRCLSLHPALSCFLTRAPLACMS